MHSHSVIRQFANSVIVPNSVIRQFGNSVIREARKGFTLIEMIVVIGIIGVLAGVLLVSFSGSTESARAALCLSNMHNLATACQTYGSATGRYPLAGSIEYLKIDESQGMSRAKSLYNEVPGWISWASEGAYRNRPSSHQASAAWMTSAYSSDDKKNIYCLTNGCLWSYVSGNRKTYVCPSHVKKQPRNPPYWSYVMNSYFGWDSSKGAEAQGESFNHIRYGDLDRADRVLLFSEIQFEQVGLPVPTGEGPDSDCVLQFSSSGESGEIGQQGGVSGDECIGVNHKSGRNLMAHVAFADGHTEKLRIPFAGSIKKPQADAGQLKKLTTWLCAGKDVSFDGKNYKEMEK